MRRFPVSPDEVPAEAVDFLARQLDVRFDAWRRYGWSGSSWKRHRRQIRAYFGYRAWTDDDIEPLVRAVVGEIDGATGTSRDRLIEAAILWCRVVSGASTINGLEDLLVVGQRGLLAGLRRMPGAVGVDSVLNELGKLAVLTDLAVPADAFAN